MLPDPTGAQALLDSLLRDAWAASKPSRVADTKNRACRSPRRRADRRRRER